MIRTFSGTRDAAAAEKRQSSDNTGFLHGMEIHLCHHLYSFVDEL